MSEHCIFCDILNKKAPADIVYEDDLVIVFKDIRPQAPVHLLVVPRKHIRSINELEEDDLSLVGHMIFVGKEMARQNNTNKSGYNLLFNVERGGGQVIFHLHLHLIGGYKR
ncbi:MAG: histidine triad nucleotide-binding protein [Desulfatibacillaceae bacterium]|nr:histidine triad nucleotide-binding protein [Desulfatibacillaceae bacterium]